VKVQFFSEKGTLLDALENHRELGTSGFKEEEGVLKSGGGRRPGP